MKTSLYRHFDEAGDLLYVGISVNPTCRLSQHKNSAKWFDSISTITIETFPSRSVALTEEAKAIDRESPKFNKIKTHLSRPDGISDEMWELINKVRNAPKNGFSADTIRE